MYNFSKCKGLFIFGFIGISIHVVGISQKYNTVGGLRFSNDLGFSVAQRLANKTTAELIFQPGTINNKTLLNVAAKQHYGLLSRRFNFFLGRWLLLVWLGKWRVHFIKVWFLHSFGWWGYFWKFECEFRLYTIDGSEKGEGQSLFSSSTGIALMVCILEAR